MLADQLAPKLPGSTEAIGKRLIEDSASVRLVKELLKARRARERLFDAELFGEPAWDVLLELYAAELLHQKLSVSGACYAAAAPATTVLRWIHKLEQCGWVKRERDPLDGRRFWLQLTGKASLTMHAYLAALAIRPI